MKKGFQTTIRNTLNTMLAGILCIFCAQAVAETQSGKNDEAKRALSPEMEYLRNTTQSASKSASRYQRELDALRIEFANYQHRIKQAIRESKLVSEEVVAARRNLQHLQQATLKNREELSAITQQVVAYKPHQLKSRAEPQRLPQEAVATRVQVGVKQGTARLNSASEITLVSSSTPTKPAPRPLKKNMQQNQSTEAEQKGIIEKATTGGVKIVKDEAVGSSKRVTKKVVRNAFNKALGL